jgi:Ni/Co efflux regulator RcnB
MHAKFLQRARAVRPMLGLKTPTELHMNTSRKTLAAGLLAVMSVVPAFADKGGGGHGKGGGHDDDRDRVVQVERGDHDRRADHDRGDERTVQLEPSQGHGCPPGLAKKHNGCMPPGQAKKSDRVIVGERVPAGAIYAIPRPVLSTLPPPPHGYRYAVVNNQVVLVSRGDIVVDILLSLAG